jgi:hypothetical protein
MEQAPKQSVWFLVFLVLGHGIIQAGGNEQRINESKEK